MFDYLNSLLYKTGEKNGLNAQNDAMFTPYMIQRWCSMYSPEISDLLNQTSNRIGKSLDSKTMWFEYLNAVVPPCRFKRLSYIKKKKETADNTNTKEVVKILANNLEISSREVNQYIEQFNLKIPHEKKQKSS